MNKKYISMVVLSLSMPVSASFYIDNQGLTGGDEVDPVGDLQGTPPGYRILSDNSYGSVHQIGKSGTIKKLSGFGAGIQLNDAMSMIMPDKWISYIDDKIKNPPLVDWSSSNEDWVKSLAVLGATYGYQFIVDWDQRMIQVSPKQGYVEPDYNKPVEMKDEENGRSIFVYSAKAVDKEGVILVDGKLIKVSIIE